MPGFFQQPISPHLSPNAQGKDIRFALWNILNVFLWIRWIRGSSVQQLDEWFKDRYKVGFARSFDGGRSALRELFGAIGISEGDEVIVQGFTCVVVPNAVIVHGATPVYVDIDETYNMDPHALQTALQSHAKVRVVVVQHTFGIPADIVKIRSLCDEFGVLLIEDCAHSLGATVGGQKVGTFGDAAMFSFGRDKVVSSVSGGVAITNNPEIGEGLNRTWLGMRNQTFYWVFQRLVHPIIFWKAKHTYYFFSLGKVSIYVGRWFNILPDVLTTSEKSGEQHSSRRLPNILARWTLSQLRRLEEFNTHRRELSALYEKELSGVEGVSIPISSAIDGAMYLRYSFEVDDSKALLMSAREDGILLGDWYNTVIGPSDCSLEDVQYVVGSCPVAENVSSRVVNVPTSPTTSVADATYVVSAIKKILK